MEKYYSIASGSKGNCGLLITNEYKILIDMGISFKYLKDSLQKHQMDICDIDFVLITHEHIDHIRGIPMFCKKTEIPVYITQKSLNFAKEKDNIKLDNIKFFKANETLNFENLVVETFKTPHDSAESVGFIISNKNFKFSYATDLGFMPRTIIKRIYNSDFVVLESNYDLDMLDYGDYPYNIKKRIKSNEGHLSNIDASLCVIELLQNGVGQIILAHLSENNNTEQNVIDQITNSVRFQKIDAQIGCNIHIAPVKNDYPILNIKKTEKSESLC